MSGYVLTPPASQDLDQIWFFLAREAGYDRADRVASDLYDAMTKLAEMPGMGHRRDDIADETLRFWRVYSYFIIYRPDTQPIQIIHVLHGARDIAAILESE